MQNPEAEKSVELLVFEIGDGRFGIDLGTVQEVVRAVLISPLPGGPPVVEGVIDVRGRIVPVYDLRARFAANPRALHADDLFVLARAGDRLVAVHCERVEWLVTVPPGTVQQAGGVRLGDRSVAGAASLEDGIILITDLATFLDDAECATLDAALAARPGPAR